MSEAAGRPHMVAVCAGCDPATIKALRDTREFPDLRVDEAIPDDVGSADVVFIVGGGDAAFVASLAAKIAPDGERRALVVAVSTIGGVAPGLASLADAIVVAREQRASTLAVRAVACVADLVATDADLLRLRPGLAGAGLSTLGVGFARGKDAASLAVDRALRTGGLFEATRLVGHIAGPVELEPASVAWIAGQVRGALSASAVCVFGRVVDPRLHDAVRVTLLAGRNIPRTEPPSDQPSHGSGDLRGHIEARRRA